MKIGLYDVDSKIPNLALMKLARFHRECGDEVVRYDPGLTLLNRRLIDKVYASKIFDFTSMTPFFHENVVIGGTGSGNAGTLSPEVEKLAPDYDFYPEFKGNMGFTMRGCRFNCKFCVVPDKEGRPVSTHTIGDLMIQDSNFLMLLDNDFFGNPDWADRLDEIRDRALRVNFAQGVNIRIITDEQAAALASVRFVNSGATKPQVTFAWDRMKDETRVRGGFARCVAAGIKPWKMQFFILIGFDTTPNQDLHRVKVIQGLGADPYVMPYDKTQPYQKAFARWVNRRLCRSVSWSEYQYGGWPVKGTGP